MSAAMKILWVFSSFDHGPPARRFAAFARRTRGAYEHVILSLDGVWDGDQLIPEGVRWRRLDHAPKKRGFVSISSLWAVRRTLSSERPDLVVTSNGGALEWLMVNRGPGAAPHLHMEDPIGAEEALDIADRNRNWARRRAFAGRGRVFLAPSEDVETAFTEQWGVAPEAVRRASPGATEALFELPPSVKGEGEAVVFGLAGPLLGARKPTRLLRLVATLRARGRDVRALVIGDGPAAASLRADAGKLGLDDAFELVQTAPSSRAGLEAMRQVDVFVQTLDVDRAGAALTDAMATARPIVGVASAFAIEAAARENRMFLRPGADESAIAAAAELLAIDPALRRAVGEANRARASAMFSEARLAARMAEIVRDLIGGPKPLMLPSPAEAATAPPAQPAAKAQATTPTQKPEAGKGPWAEAAARPWDEMRIADDLAIPPEPAAPPAPLTAPAPLSAKDETTAAGATGAASFPAEEEDDPYSLAAREKRRRPAALTREVLARTRGDKMGGASPAPVAARFRADAG